MEILPPLFLEAVLFAISFVCVLNVMEDFKKIALREYWVDLEAFSSIEGGENYADLGLSSPTYLAHILSLYQYKLLNPNAIYWDIPNDFVCVISQEEIKWLARRFVRSGATLDDLRESEFNAVQKRIANVVA